MVSPVRIRVPPLIKVLQITEKGRVQTVLSEHFVGSVSTAGSKEGLF
jgi:hypothetical protein